MRPGLVGTLALFCLACSEPTPDEPAVQDPPASPTAPAKVEPPPQPLATPPIPAPSVPTPGPPARSGFDRTISDSCAIRSAKLWCWESPWLGGKAISTVSAPKSIADDCVLLDNHDVVCVKDGVATEVPALKGVVALGKYFFTEVCGVRPSGTIVCWSKDEPVTEIEGITDAVDLALGRRFGCALRRDGGVSCWGVNENGQLGHPPPFFGASKEQPPAVVEGLADVVELAAGRSHACARTQAGDVHCWGEGLSGQTGAADRPKVTPPTKVLAGASAIGVGNDVSCALVEGGLRCWGLEMSGPTTIPGVSGATAMDIGEVGCVRSDDRVWCWVADVESMPAGEAVWRAEVPGAKQAKLGATGPLVLTEAGKLVAFDPIWHESSILAGLGELSEFDVHGGTLCVIEAGVGRRCWSGTPKEEWPRDADEPALHALAVWRDRGCGITEAGKMACWDTESGPKISHLGNALGKLVDVVAIGHRCVIDRSGKIRCFGPNEAGELGQGNVRATNDQLVPKGVGNVAEIDSDLEYTCARTKSGTVKCWGGEFPHDGKPSAPHDVGVSGAVQIAVGEQSGCARSEVGTISCWREWVDWEQEPPVLVTPGPATPRGFEGSASDIRMNQETLCAVFGAEVRCWWGRQLASTTLPIEVGFEM